jgi:hypothetical protein
MPRLGGAERGSLTMQIENEELAWWARFADKVRNQALWLGRLMAAGRLTEARNAASELHLEAARTLTAMENAGAEIPAYLPAMPDVPLEVLTSPANCRLYRALREAAEAAREVDRERGREVGWSDFITDKLNRVELEVYGPAGHGEGH